VEGNDFTLLKDNGIQEASNFLTMGDVVRAAGNIQSLISSRKAPGHKAAIFLPDFLVVVVETTGKSWLGNWAIR